MYLKSGQSTRTVLQVSLHFGVLVLGSLSWPRGLNTLQLKKMYANRKTEQIMKTSSSISQLICSKSTQCNQIQKNATTKSEYVYFVSPFLVGKEPHGFIDLEMLPPELGITILSYLNATDLCLAGCVWQGLGNDEYLWQG